MNRGAFYRTFAAIICDNLHLSIPLDIKVLILQLNYVTPDQVRGDTKVFFFFPGGQEL
jgi:hypothetical protein